MDVFVQGVIDLAAMLSDLDKQGEATEDEQETLTLLSRRLIDVLQVVERERYRRRIQIELRQRGHEGRWRL